MTLFRHSIAGNRSTAACRTSGAAAAVLNVAMASLAVAAPVLSNVDSGLQKLAHGETIGVPGAGTTSGGSARSPRLGAASQTLSLGRFDSLNRVLVHVHLDGTTPLATVSASLTSLGAKVLGTNVSYSRGILAAYVPIPAIAAAAGTKGVRDMTIEHTPAHHVGSVTAESTEVLHTDVLNKLGLRGDGITVGVLSDSFDTAYENTASPPATRAAQDVATGDLPVVNVLEDFPNGTDEGRAMCQVVYDEAPHCKLAFATGDVSEVDFANNIVNLRTQAGASVIVDDLAYYDEPVFSDGFVAQTVDAVSNDKTLPGKPVVYVSSAGNDANNGYRSVYRNLSDREVRQTGHHGNLKLNVTDPNSPNYLDPSLTAGGWFNWNPSGGSEPSTAIYAPGPTDFLWAFFLQWDDPFDLNDGITTNFNFLVFDANGNYLPALSSTESAFDYQEPIQAIGYLSLGTTYQIAITRTTQTDPLAGPIAKNYHLALYSTLDSASTIEGTYFHPAPLDVPTVFGHATSRSAVAVAAYASSWRPGPPLLPELENYTSPGPAAFYFDSQLNRLTTPEVRLKPEVAGIDGCSNTFFGAPYYYQSHAFFGTSCAAPSVAGVAALMQQANGGPGSVAWPAVKAALEASARPRNGTVQQVRACGVDKTSSVAITALGQNYFGPNFYTVSYPKGASGDEIDQLTIDGSAAGLGFYTAYSLGIGTTHGIPAADITIVPAPDDSSSFSVTFKKGAFKPGDSFSFSVDLDVAGTFPGYTQDDFGVGTEAEDLAYGAKATVTFGAKGHAPLGLAFREGPFVSGYLPSDGYGEVDAISAVLHSFLKPCALQFSLQAAAN